jgi:hypothetical protein
MKIRLKKPFQLLGGRSIAAGNIIEVTDEKGYELHARGAADIIGMATDTTFEPIPWQYVEKRSEEPDNISMEMDEYLESMIPAEPEPDFNRDNYPKKKKKRGEKREVRDE